MPEPREPMQITELPGEFSRNANGERTCKRTFLIRNPQMNRGDMVGVPKFGEPYIDQAGNVDLGVTVQDFVIRMTGDPFAVEVDVIYSSRTSEHWRTLNH